MRTIDSSIAGELLAREGLYLDTRDWDRWLDLFTRDAVFWVPAWKGPYQSTDSPEAELSLMYMKGVEALRERVWRIESGLSRASLVTTRTVHAVGGVTMRGDDGGSGDAVACSGGAVHVYLAEKAIQHVHLCRYEHTLVWSDDKVKIARKRIVLMNDRIPTMLDFNHV